MATSAIRVSFVIDVDKEAWAAEYGISSKEVATDVRAYIQNAAVEHLRELGLGQPA